MEKIYLIGVFLIFMMASSHAQEKLQQDSKSKPIETQAAKDEMKPGKGKFLDENGDGLDDVEQSGKKRKGKQGRMDRFEDKDGDGVNDNRSKGMGWSGRGKQCQFGRHKK